MLVTAQIIPLDRPVGPFPHQLYLYTDNVTTGGSLTGAILSCHVEISKYSTSKLQKNTQIIRKNEYTVLLGSIIAIQKFVNSFKKSY